MRLVPEHDVLDRVQRRHEIELLIDHADAQPLGRAGRVDANDASIDEDPAGIGRLRAGQNLHERRLAGAVLTDQRQHFAGIELQRNVIQRPHPGKRFPDAAHLQ